MHDVFKGAFKARPSHCNDQYQHLSFGYRFIIRHKVPCRLEFLLSGWGPALVLLGRKQAKCQLGWGQGERESKVSTGGWARGRRKRRLRKVAN